MNVLLFSAIGLLAIGFSQAQTPTGLCAGRPAGTLMQDFTDCTRFFRCPGGTGAPARGTCDPGRFFNIATGQCVLTQAHCFRCPVDNPFVELPVPTSCQQFIRCINGQAQHLECGNGLGFDQRIRSCNIPTLGACPALNCPPTDDPNNRIWLRDAQNCAAFFVCVNGHAVYKSCPEGLQFNTNTRLCDFQHIVQCRNQ